MPKYKALLASFPYSSPNNIHLSQWITRTIVECREDPRFGPGNVAEWHVADTPITMGRNQAVQVAEAQGFDFLVMYDDDMHPDLPYQGAKPFWQSTIDFMIDHPGPCAVAAPYCGPPPEENCYCFRWTNKESGHPNADFQIESYSRAECEGMTGIQQCAAFPTGLCIIDVRAFAKLRRSKKPAAEVLELYKAGAITLEQAQRLLKMPASFFYYEWKDDTQTQKSSTEDVTFSRDLFYAGVPIYVNWASWAGHRKLKTVGKPGHIPAAVVPEWMRQRAMEFAKTECGIAMPAVNTIIGETPLPPTNRIERYDTNVAVQAADGREPVHAGRR